MSKLVAATDVSILDEQADQAIASWTFGAFAANLLPPPFDVIVVGSVFARLGARLGEIYGVEMNWSVLKNIGKSIAKGSAAVLTASYIGTGLFKYLPGVNLWVALLVQPPIVAAVAYSVGQAFKQYYRIRITEGRDLTPDQMREMAESTLRERLAT